ncbi:hypothetical protein MA16_Dca006781 [Dendrobium catenatum]|uniref:Uncharacterized protein n=1 Tax=Dendrobium catenatum TaxID=906689 RepID=A0A2I0W950_9ASPA|nr:hypothetical protein MA16_Dca006781 [Dendrobium catenatum]
MELRRIFHYTVLDGNPSVISWLSFMEKDVIEADKCEFLAHTMLRMDHFSYFSSLKWAQLQFSIVFGVQLLLR